MKICLSSCWNSHRHTDGYEMLEELMAFGVDAVELSHGVRVSLVPGIFRALDEGKVRVASVHNFCPLPTGVLAAAPNLYEPTARTRDEQELWFRHTIKTIDFAHRVGADLMVIHSGSARFLWGHPEKRRAAAESKMEGGGEAEKKAYDQALEKGLRRIRKKQKPYFERLVQNFQRILPFAQEKGVRIAIENREAFTELPLDEDMGKLLETLGEPGVYGYWHDTGHAQLKERMGLRVHREALEEHRPRQFGFHLHDVSEEGSDHCPLGSGVIDWSMVSSFFRPDDLLVLEMSPRVRSEEIRRSLEFLRGLLG